MQFSATTSANPDPHDEAVRSKIAEGDLAGAVAAAKDAVRADASNADRRELLFNVLALVCDWPAAARQAETAGQLDPKRIGPCTAAATAVACEQDRAAVWRGETTPTILGEPAQWVGKLVAAAKYLHGGEVAAAAELAAEARGEAVEQSDDAALAGSVTVDAPDGPRQARFVNWADSDDRLGPVWELFADGRYVWAPPGAIAEIRLAAPASLRELIWQPAVVTWSAGGTSGALLPVRYFGTETAGDASLTTSKRTDYAQPHDNLYVGQGQRIWLSALDGETSEWPALQVRNIRFDLADALETSGEEAAERE